MRQQGSAYQADPRRVIPRLLSRLGEVLGEEACRAMFHYAAVQEGRQAGGALPRGDLLPLLDHVDSLLDQKTKILQEEEDYIQLEVRNSALLASADGSLYEIVVGFLEGAFSAYRGRKYEGKVEETLGDEDATTTLCFEVASN